MSAYSVAVLADSPRGYWRFDDLLDSSGLGHTLTLSGSAPTTAGLLLSEASLGRSFTDTNADVLTAADHADLDLGNTFSMEAWFTMTAVPGAGTVNTIMTKGNQGYQLTVDQNALLLGVQDGVGEFVRSSVALSTGVTYYACCTKTGDTIKMWLGLVGTDTLPQDKTGAITNGRVCTNNALDLSIGNGNGNQPWFGTLDEPAVYSTVLSQARAEAHYTAGIAAVSSGAFQ